MMSKILEDFNWLKKYSGYPDKCATLEPVIRKATPKKPNNYQKYSSDSDAWGKCPDCNKDVCDYADKYCPNCSKALDWSENDE